MEYGNITLEEHRSRTIGEILEKLHNADRVCCVRYTNYGKTYWVIRPLINIYHDKKFLLLAPLDSLRQGFRDIFNQPNVQVYLYQNLLKLSKKEIREKFNNIDYIVCDECHHLGENKWAAKVEEIYNIINKGNVKIIGLTASPLRGDGIDVTETFFKGNETSRFNMLDGIKAGYLPKIEYYIGQCTLTEKQKKVYDEKMNDVDRYKIDKLLNIPYWIEKIINDDRLEDNLKIVAFTPFIKDIDIAEESCKEWFDKAFPDKTIKIFKYHSGLSKKENETNFRLYSDDKDKNSIDILISRDKAAEGTHLENCSIAILLRNTKSPTVYMQQIGRAVNKRKAIVFDFVNNYKRVNMIKKEIEETSQETIEQNINREKKMFYDCVNIHFENVDLLNDTFGSFNKCAELTKEQKEYILQNYQNKNLKQLGEDLGKSAHCVANFLVSQGLHEIQSNRISSKKEAEIVNALEKSIKEGTYKGAGDIGTQYNVSASAVKRIIKRHNIIIPTGKTYREQRDLKIIEMYKNTHMTHKQIGEKLGVHGDVVSDTLKRNGIISDRITGGARKKVRNHNRGKELLLANLSYIKDNMKLVSKSDMSKKFGMNITTFSNILKDIGIDYKYIEPKEIWYNMNMAKKVVGLEADGFKQPEICDKLGISLYKIYKLKKLYMLEVLK